jgi:hypothetical protein
LNLSLLRVEFYSRSISEGEDAGGMCGSLQDKVNVVVFQGKKSDLDVRPTSRVQPPLLVKRGEESKREKPKSGH